MSDRGRTAPKTVPEQAIDELRAELRSLLAETAVLTEPVEIRPDRGIDMREEVAKYERDLIVAALHLANGKQREAARLLHLSPSTLNVKMKSLAIDPKNF